MEKLRCHNGNLYLMRAVVNWPQIYLNHIIYYLVLQFSINIKHFLFFYVLSMAKELSTISLFFVLIILMVVLELAMGSRNCQKLFKAVVHTYYITMKLTLRRKLRCYAAQRLYNSYIMRRSITSQFSSQWRFHHRLIRVWVAGLTNLLKQRQYLSALSHWQISNFELHTHSL